MLNIRKIDQKLKLIPKKTYFNQQEAKKSSLKLENWVENIKLNCSNV
jgi:hypothetical protein